MPNLLQLMGGSGAPQSWKSWSSFKNKEFIKIKGFFIGRVHLRENALCSSPPSSSGVRNYRKKADWGDAQKSSGNHSCLLSLFSIQLFPATRKCRKINRIITRERTIPIDECIVWQQSLHCAWRWQKPFLMRAFIACKQPLLFSPSRIRDTQEQPTMCNKGVHFLRIKKQAEDYKDPTVFICRISLFQVSYLFLKAWNK